MSFFRPVLGKVWIVFGKNPGNTHNSPGLQTEQNTFLSVLSVCLDFSLCCVQGYCKNDDFPVGKKGSSCRDPCVGCSVLDEQGGHSWVYFLPL